MWYYYLHLLSFAIFLWFEAIFWESFTIYWWTFITRLLIQKHLHINQICNASFGGVGGPGGGISYKENYLFTWLIFKTGGNIYMTRPKMDIFVSLLAAWLLQIPSKTSHIFIKWHFGPSSNYRVRFIKLLKLFRLFTLYALLTLFTLLKLLILKALSLTLLLCSSLYLALCWPVREAVKRKLFFLGIFPK